MFKDCGSMSDILLGVDLSLLIPTLCYVVPSVVYQFRRCFLIDGDGVVSWGEGADICHIAVGKYLVIDIWWKLFLKQSKNIVCYLPTV